MKIILKIIIVALVIMALPQFIAGISVSGFYPALIAALIFGILNLLVKPIVNLIALPINLLTLGLFGLVINGLLFWLVASFVDGFSIESFLPAFLGALVVSVANWLASHI